MKILIIDDDFNRSNTLKNHLAINAGIDEDQVSIAGDSSSGIEMLRTSYYEVLILDVILPKRQNESGSSRNGIDLLRAVLKGKGIRKPNRIIGITANIKDIGLYRQQFIAACTTVIEATPGDSAWRSTLCDIVSYSKESGVAKVLSSSDIEIISIHGIQTFGKWQNKLHRLVSESVGSVGFHSYKYGVFSALAFFIPYFRSRESEKLKKALIEKFQSTPNKRIVIFSHSFGTFLLHSSLLKIISSGEFPTLPVKRIVLSGSVLKHRTDWSLFAKNNIQVINDCADHDYTLYLSQFFVWGVGMGGRSGFYGFSDGLMINRFFKGGHSSFFIGDSFIRDFWLPLLNLHSDVEVVDKRNFNFIRHGVIDKLALFLGPIVTLFSYALIIGLFIFSISAIFL